jgi:hypothetical protein
MNNNNIKQLLKSYNKKCIDKDNNTIVNDYCKIISKEINTYYINSSVEYKKIIK